MADSNCLENAWDEPGGRYGQTHLQHADRPERPNLSQAYDRIAPRLAERLNNLDQQFAKEGAGEASEHTLNLRRAAA